MTCKERLVMKRPGLWVYTLKHSKTNCVDSRNKVVKTSKESFIVVRKQRRGGEKTTVGGPIYSKIRDPNQASEGVDRRKKNQLQGELLDFQPIS